MTDELDRMVLVRIHEVCEEQAPARPRTFAVDPLADGRCFVLHNSQRSDCPECSGLVLGDPVVCQECGEADARRLAVEHPTGVVRCGPCIARLVLAGRVVELEPGTQPAEGRAERGEARGEGLAALGEDERVH